jgi:endosialidase-like protein
MSSQVDRPDPGPVIPGDGPINGFEVLDQVADLPISTWRYHWEAPQVRHLGPMAQDWAATFGLGENDTTIAAVDASGVALVSIQALYRLIGELRQEVAELRGQVSALADHHQQ